MFSHSRSPSVRSTLLYLSGKDESNRNLQQCLCQQGFHLQAVETAQEIANLLFSKPVADAILIRNDHLDTGSMIACSFRFIRPQITIILLSSELPTGDQLPVGIDILFCANLHSEDAVPQIASAIRKLMAVSPGGSVLGSANAYLN